MILWFNFRLKLSDFLQLCFGFTHFWNHEVPEDPTETTVDQDDNDSEAEEDTEVPETFQELRGRDSIISKFQLKYI